jgi:MOSC domain-containing protein YiiM
MKDKPLLPNNRQIHVIGGELFEELSSAGFKVTAGQLGENVTTSGLDLGILPLGTSLHLGPSSVVELTGLRTPCFLIDRFQKGLKRAMIGPKTARPRFRCGVLGVVLQSGIVGDEVKTVLPALPWQDSPAL